jgi:hypothetical protein
LFDCRVGDLQRTCKILLERYGSPNLAVAEEQAAPFFVFLTGCAKHQWTEIAEETVGRLYNDLVKNFGRVAHEELSGADILRLMQQR